MEIGSERQAHPSPGMASQQSASGCSDNLGPSVAGKDQFEHHSRSSVHPLDSLEGGCRVHLRIAAGVKTGRGCRHLLTTFHRQVYGAGNVGLGDCPFYVYCTYKWCPSSSVARHSCLPYESFVEQQTCNAGLALSITVEWLAILLLVREISFSILSE